ncbi:MAG: ATP-dependent DNA ligase [Candidatus Zipacnadales bacterium]
MPLVDAFASVADRVAATTKKLEKRSILAAYLRSLSEEDLAVATVFLTGRPFPLRSELTVNVGAALLGEAVMQLTGLSPEEYEATYIPLGDLGEAVGVLRARCEVPPTSMKVAEVRELCERLAQTSTLQVRSAMLVEALKACRPPAAKYLVKILTATLRIGVQESLIEEAIADAFGHKVEPVRRANMLLGDLGQTAVLARQNRLAEARLSLFHPVKFMLATPIEEPEEAFQIRPVWLVEDKFDGIRCQAHHSARETRLYSRTLDEITHQFPEIVAAFHDVTRELLLDGELIAQKEGRPLGFGQLAKRLGRKRPEERLIYEIPVVFIAFDLLALDGELLLNEPLYRRREMLDALPPIPSVVVPPLLTVTDAQGVRREFAAALERHNEGLMLKDGTSIYQPGRRGQAWLKLKRPLATLDVVVVAAEYGHGRRRGLLSDYTFAVRDKERLVTVGKAYSGVTEQEIAFLTDHFQRHAVKDFGRGMIVPPEIVLEVAFNAINRSTRYQSGFALRFPRIKRLRLDKSLADIDTLDRVRELWEKQQVKS